MGYRLGIDLGTTFTAAAVLRDGRPEVFPLGDHGLEIPSVVLLRPDGTFVVGDAAERQGLAAPHRLAREFKRRTGDGTSLRLAGTPYPAHSLTAVLLRWVVQRVTQRESAPPDDIVVTHPANWGPFKRELLQHATSLADLDGVLLCTEPEAAAMHYASLQRLQIGDVVAVYDLGGGTFDTAVLARTADGFELLGTPVGIEQLGGVDFDDALFHDVLAALGDAVQDIDPADETAMAGVARLRRDCVLAKEALSEDPEFSVPVNLPGLHTQVRLTRGEFEDLIRPRVVDTVSALRRALRLAEVDPQDLSAVLLAGGSSRIPLVAATISAELGRPVSVDAHPKHLVALGAARYGAATTGSRRPVAVPPPPPEEPGEDHRGLGAPPGSAQSPAVPVAAAAAAAPATHVAAGADRAETGGPAVEQHPPGRTGDGPPSISPPDPTRPPPGRRPRPARTLRVRSSAHSTAAAVRATSRRVATRVGTGAHGVAQLLGRGVRPLRTVRPTLPVIGAVTAVLMITALVVVLAPDFGDDSGSDPSVPACSTSPDPTAEALFAIPPPPGRADQFHLQGGAVHTWLHEADGRLEVVAADADDPCYPYGDGRWGVADVDGDDRSDLVHVTGDGVRSWIAQGGGAYDVVPAGDGTAGDVSGLWGAADVDGDGDADLVHVTAEGVSTWTGDGSGGFMVGPPHAGPQRPALEQGLWRAADVDGDGLTDLVHVLDSGVETWFSRPGGSYEVKIAPASYPYSGGTWLTADVTVDGRADLIHVIRGQVEPGDTTSRGRGAVVTWVSLGDGRYEAAAEPQEGPGRYYPYGKGQWFAANVDQDVAAEVLHRNGAGVTIWQFLGEGRYERRPVPLSRAPSDDMTVTWRVGDVQGDGRADLVQVWDEGVDTWISQPDGSFRHAGSTEEDYDFRRGVWLGTTPVE